MSPRIGIAWSPDKLHGKTVIRTGFGLFAAPILINYLAQNGNYSSNPIIDQEGFSQQTVMTPSTNNYLSPSATFSDPFPGGAILQPNAAAVGPDHVPGQHDLVPESESQEPVLAALEFRLPAQPFAEHGAGGGIHWQPLGAHARST